MEIEQKPIQYSELIELLNDKQFLSHMDYINQLLDEKCDK